MGFPQEFKRDVEVRDRDETETFDFESETRPRPGHSKFSRDQDETETFDFGSETEIETFLETVHTSMFKSYHTTLTSSVRAFVL